MNWTRPKVPTWYHMKVDHFMFVIHVSSDPKGFDIWYRIAGNVPEVWRRSGVQLDKWIQRYHPDITPISKEKAKMLIHLHKPYERGT